MNHKPTPTSGKEVSRVITNMITFAVRGIAFGLNIFHVKEILNYQEITRAPSMPPGVVGMISIRGDLLPVLDLKKFLFGEDTAFADKPLLMITETGGRSQVLLVDSVDRIVELTFKDIQPQMLSSESEYQAVMGVYESPGTPDNPDKKQLISILHLENILARISPVRDEGGAVAAKRASVLVVDDSGVARKHIVNGLTKAGLDCVPATSADHALSLLQSAHVDLILTDAEMPGMDGFEFISTLRMDSTFAKMPIVMYSGLSDSVSETRGIKAGASQFVHKYDLNKLVEAVNAQLA